MAVTRYTKMAYDSADDLVFGQAKHPVSYGFEPLFQCDRLTLNQ